MNSTLLDRAKRDLPLYLNDFKTSWEEKFSAISDKDLIDCYVCTLIYKNWKISLNSQNIHTLNDLLDEIHEDVNTAFLYSFLKQYRSSYMHLRSVIELSLQMMYFYQHEVEYEQWKEGKFRMKHEDLLDYLKKHPALKQKESNDLLDQISQKWKLFSKHIHAENPNFFQKNITKRINKGRNRVDDNKWQSTFLTTINAINLILLIFFKRHIQNIPTQNKQILVRNLKEENLLSLNITP